jgi:hypothetical protein
VELDGAGGGGAQGAWRWLRRGGGRQAPGDGRLEADEADGARTGRRRPAGDWRSGASEHGHGSSRLLAREIRRWGAPGGLTTAARGSHSRGRWEVECGGSRRGGAQAAGSGQRMSSAGAVRWRRRNAEVVGGDAAWSRAEDGRRSGSGGWIRDVDG